MKADDRKMVNWYKAQLKSYICSEPVRQKIESRLSELDNLLNYHSPPLSSDVHGSAKTHDQKLADYITKRDRFIAQLKSFQEEQKVVEAILNLIPEDTRNMILRVHRGKRTIEGEAVRAGMSKNNIQQEIDREILRAVKEYLNTVV